MPLAVFLRAFFLLVLSMPVLAAARDFCATHFHEQSPPVIRSELLQRNVKGLCFLNFAVGHSGMFRAPLWVAEHVTRDELVQARQLKRNGQFYAEPRLSREERAELSDYARSGFDRGHMAPAADMPDTMGMLESFSLANIVPQHPENNQRLWAEIEAGVRKTVLRYGEAYIVTGPVYSSPQMRLVGNRVAVPDSLYKAVYIPGRGAAVYVTSNGPDSDVRIYSVAQAEQALRIELFPGLAQDVKERKTPLLEILPYKAHRQAGGGGKKAGRSFRMPA